MKQTRPNMIITKYRSILVAAIVVETVSFVVSLTDSIIAGLKVGADAFAAIGLLFPFVSLSTFFASTINSGTVLLFSDETGAFHKKRAHEYFSQGVILAVATGVLFTGLMLLFKDGIISILNPTTEMTQFLSDYYDIYIYYFLLVPISCLLDNLVIADGGEKLSAVSNSIQIVGNIVLSVILSQSMGVKGIALATVLCKALFIVLISIWFFTKHCTLKMIFCLHLSDCLLIAKRGVVKATTFAMTTATTYLLNAYVLRFYDGEALQILILSEKIVGLSTIFLGLAMAIQPLVGTLNGEGNTKALRLFLRRASIDMIIAGVIVSGIVISFAEPIVKVFGITEPELVERGVIATYISAATLIFSACFFIKDYQMTFLPKEVYKPFGWGKITGSIELK